MLLSFWQQLLSHLVNLFHSAIKFLKSHAKFTGPEKWHHSSKPTNCREIADDFPPFSWHLIKICRLDLDVTKDTEQSEEYHVWRDLQDLPLGNPVENECPCHNGQHSNNGAKDKCLKRLTLLDFSHGTSWDIMGHHGTISVRNDFKYLTFWSFDNWVFTRQKNHKFRSFLGLWRPLQGSRNQTKGIPPRGQQKHKSRTELSKANDDSQQQCRKTKERPNGFVESGDQHIVHRMPRKQLSKPSNCCKEKSQQSPNQKGTNSSRRHPWPILREKKQSNTVHPTTNCWRTACLRTPVTC